MDLQSIRLKDTYWSGEDNLLSEFYIPCLMNSNYYDRAVGYFNSSILKYISKGMYDFIKNNGKMRLICSLELSKEDMERMEEGYSSKVLEEKLDKTIKELLLDENSPELKNIAWLIKNHNLDIKICLKTDFSETSIFHEKFGIFKDKNNNILTFMGSINETKNGWMNNVESFEVSYSWEPVLYSRVLNKVERFENLWNGTAKNIKTYGFPEALKKELIKIAPESPIYMTYGGENSIYEQFNQEISSNNDKKSKEPKLRNYQVEAIDSWFENKGKGLFEMATGTGKTFTALAVLKKLYGSEKKLIGVISCPQKHLIHQWAENLKLFDIDLPIIITSDNPKWESNLIQNLLNTRLNVQNGVLIITSHRTYSAPRFIEIIEKYLDKIPSILIVDEAHGAGAPKYSKGLHNGYKYRLGLSATPERYFDEEGTDFLKDYFEKTVYEFDLKRAINEINPDTGETYLTPYEYNVIFVELSKNETLDYIDKTMSIVRIYGKNKKTQEDYDKLDNLLRERANIIKNAENKYKQLNELILDLKNSKNLKKTLIYVSPNQIKKVNDMLLKKNIRNHKFTAEEDPETKKDILNLFTEGDYDTLVAMKCLDEGVDIPSAENAILLCSSGNPKEYIQRRGRILRRSPGKSKAVIYDFLAFPKSEFYAYNTIVKNIVDNQLKRVEDFAENSLNESEVLRSIFDFRVFNGL